MKILSLILSVLTLCVAPALGLAQSKDPTEFFETRIRPVLVNNCYACNTQSQLGGLRVDSRELLLKGGKSGPAIVPGQPEASLLVRAIRHSSEQLKMPMGGKLKEQEIADLTEWVKLGAPWPEGGKIIQAASSDGGFMIKPEQRAFWSFQPLRKPELPQVKDRSWVKNPIDQFILAQLEERGLKPVKAADKRTLIRRATLDLVGLPPKPEEVEAFVKDETPEAFAKVVDQLLASPHYGERWGRYWLDVARYGEDDVRSDTAVPYSNAWRYRDWVVQALNQDMPYDLFVKAQIAGDLIDQEIVYRGDKTRRLNHPSPVASVKASQAFTPLPTGWGQGVTKEKLSLAPTGGEGGGEGETRVTSSPLLSNGTPEGGLQNSSGTLIYQYAPGTGFFGLGPWYYDIAQPAQARADERNDRVDTLTRGFLGLTVACARCHDHKYDPISIKDYYALAGVFSSSEYEEYPLVPEHLVAEYKKHQKTIQSQEKAIQQFLQAESRQLGEILARKTSRYIVATWKVLGPEKLETAKVAEQEKLDRETLERWVRYLENPRKEYPYLKAWNELLTRGGTLEEALNVASDFQTVVLRVVTEKKEIDEENELLLAQAKPKEKPGERLLPNAFVTYYDYCPQCLVTLKIIDREKFVLWNDLFANRPDKNDPARQDGGVLHYQDEKLERFLSGEWKAHLESMRAELQELKKGLPVPYSLFHGMRESLQPANFKLHLRGNPFSLGEEVPRRFLAVLSEDEPSSFRDGSGRLELAEAVASHPLTARVIVNRVWHHHFGRGIVGSASNFGQLGERPSHPELLEYLTASFKEGGSSLTALHRQIMLSATYQLSADLSRESFSLDPDNRLLWRANRRRLDAEALRDSFLFVSGGLDATVGGPSVELNDESRRLTVYSKISRFKINALLRLFDFPDPSITSEQRNVTNVPLQGLFFMNSLLITNQAELLAKRLYAVNVADDAARIKEAYRLLYSREAAESDVQFGLSFLQKAAGQAADGPSPWQQYAQVLLSSNEFVFVN